MAISVSRSDSDIPRCSRSGRTCSKACELCVLAAVPALDGSGFDDLFAQLVLPLRDRRSVCLEADYAAEYATRLCRYDDGDVILLEGIFLLKRAFRAFYDLLVGSTAASRRPSSGR